VGVLLVMVAAAATAATIATAARPLTIVWSHYLRPVICRTGLFFSDPLPFVGAVRLIFRGINSPSATNGPDPSPPKGLR
jgi:hypothetical protein